MEPPNTRPSSFLATIEATVLGSDVATESRSRENSVPAVSVYRWWARRTEAEIGSIIDAFAATRSGRIDIADLFAGGGTVPLAALRRGHRAYAQDISPWAAHGLEMTLKLIKPHRLAELAILLENELEPQFKNLYTSKLENGSAATLAHTIRVLKSVCSSCGQTHRCFPFAMVSLTERKERSDGTAFLACTCGHVWKASSSRPSGCPNCSSLCNPEAKYLQGRRVTCPSCGAREKLDARLGTNKPSWDVVLVERTTHEKRELAIPNPQELWQFEQFPSYSSLLEGLEIPDGPETRRLRRAGFSVWSDIYPQRQEYALNHLAECVASVSASGDEQRVLMLAVTGCAETPGLLSRWDRYYLKQYEAMAGHRISPATLVVEPNVWGAPRSGRGSMTRRLKHLQRASQWLHDELQLLPLSVRVTHTSEEQIKLPLCDDVHIVVGDSRRTLLEDSSVDLVLTDPPYHDDVQYADLASLFEAWQGLSPAGEPLEVLAARDGMRHLDHLNKVFQEAYRILRNEGHLVLTFSNRSSTAWVRLFEALQGAGFWPQGYAILHSENEIDGFKRGKRSCVHDLVMDLVKRPSGLSDCSTDAAGPSASEEVALLRLVASYFMQVGELHPDWALDFAKQFVECEFVRVTGSVSK